MSVNDRDRAIAGGYGMTPEERRMRAIRIKQRDSVAFSADEFSEEEKEEDAKLLKELKEAQDKEEEEAVEALRRSPPANIARLKAQAKKSAATRSGVNWTELTPFVKEELEWAADHTESMNSWEQCFVESVNDFAANKGGLTTTQWNKLQEVIGRYSHLR